MWKKVQKYLFFGLLILGHFQGTIGTPFKLIKKEIISCEEVAHFIPTLSKSIKNFPDATVTKLQKEHLNTYLETLYKRYLSNEITWKDFRPRLNWYAVLQHLAYKSDMLLLQHQVTLFDEYFSEERRKLILLKEHHSSQDKQAEITKIDERLLQLRSELGWVTNKETSSWWLRLQPWQRNLIKASIAISLIAGGGGMSFHLYKKMVANKRSDGSGGSDGNTLTEEETSGQSSGAPGVEQQAVPEGNQSNQSNVANPVPTSGAPSVGQQAVPGNNQSNQSNVANPLPANSAHLQEAAVPDALGPEKTKALEELNSFLKALSNNDNDKDYVESIKKVYTDELNKFIKEEGITKKKIEEKVKGLKKSILLAYYRRKEFIQMCKDFGFGDPKRIYNGAWITNYLEAHQDFDKEFVSKKVGFMDAEDAVQNFFNDKREELKAAYARRIWDQANGKYKALWKKYKEAKGSTSLFHWNNNKDDFIKWLYETDTNGLQHLPEGETPKPQGPFNKKYSDKIDEKATAKLEEYNNKLATQSLAQSSSQPLTQIKTK